MNALSFVDSAKYNTVILYHTITDVTMLCCIQKKALVVSSLEFGAKASPWPPLLQEGGEVGMLTGLIRRYLDGEVVDLTAIAVDMSRQSPFEQAVLSAARTVGYGQRCSYAELAARAGAPRAVRAAASVMRRNRLALLVPCHRIVRADGAVGGFMGAADGAAVELKQRLLQLEQDGRRIALLHNKPLNFLTHST
jgi:O-6-methylguanine DNA methyltransferase